MRARVSYENGSGVTCNTHVRLGQQLVVGSSFSADIVLGNTTGVTSEHVELSFQGDNFSLRNLTGNADTVLVNGQPTSRSVLSDGDSIEIGTNRLAVSLDLPATGRETTTSHSGGASGAGTAMARDTETDDVSNESDATKENYKLERFGQVTVLTIESFAKDVFPILESGDSPWQCQFIYNHQRSGSSEQKPDSLNFLENGSPEIVAENDLFLQTLTGQPEFEKMWERYAKKDAGIIAVYNTDSQKAAIETGFQYLAAWFMVPSRLQFHLTRGSKLLNDKVFGLYSFLVVNNNSGDQIILNDSNIDSLDGFLQQLQRADQ